MIASMIVQRQAAQLYRRKSPITHSINELSWRAYHGRPAALAVTFVAKGGRMYATVPSATPTPTPKPAGIPPRTEVKKKAKVELRPSPKLPEAPSTSAAASTSNAPPPPTPSTSASLAASQATELETAPPPLPMPPAVAEGTQKHGLRTSIDQAIADVLKASREGQLAAIDPSLPWAKRMFKWGVELFKFYYRGVKRFWEHRKIVKEISSRCKEEGRSRTWREERFVQLYRSDRVKLAPFILTLLILEEAIPLMVIYTPFLLPSTCILHSQQERMEENRLAKHRAGLAALATALSKNKVDKQGVAYTTSLPELSPEIVKGLAGVLSLRTYFPIPFLRARISSRISHLMKDDVLLQPALPGLDIHELRQAVTERGGLAASATGEQLTTWLSRWLEGVKQKDASGTSEDPTNRRIRLVLDYAWSQCGAAKPRPVQQGGRR